MIEKEYLGDSVYAEVDDYGAIALTTCNGYEPTNTIILEMQVIDYLVDYIVRAKSEIAARKPIIKT